MRPHRIFAILAVFYILSILILPRLIPSEALDRVWNPRSLLHLPLYGILMVLLSAAFSPGLFHAERPSLRLPSLFLAGGIAFLTGILDELNQRFIPGRDASLMDLLLNLTGIGLTGLGIFLFHRKRQGRR